MAWIVPVLKWGGRVLVDILAWKGAESAYLGIKNAVSNGVENAISQRIDQRLNTPQGEKMTTILEPLYNKTDEAMVMVNNMKGSFMNGLPIEAQYQAIVNDGKPSFIEAAPHLIDMATDKDPFVDFDLSDLIEIYLVGEYGDKLQPGQDYSTLAQQIASTISESVDEDGLSALRRRLGLYIITNSEE